MTEPIRVSIGSEPKCWLSAEVLKSSIVRRTAREVAFTESWTQRDGWHPLMRRKPGLKQGTGFSAWRWWVPELYGWEGRTIYLDSDIVLLADIAELWDSLQPGKWFAAVTNVDPYDWWGYPKTIRSAKKRYANKVQTSVMVMDCAACRWDCPTEFKRRAYPDLMQAEWIPRDHVQEIDRQWNRFGKLDDGTKLLHWSHVASQPQKRPDHPTGHVFRAELQAALEAGRLTARQVNAEIEKGYAHASYRVGV